MTKLCDFKRDNPTVLAWLKMEEHEKLYNLKQSIISSTFSVTFNVQSVHPWPERKAFVKSLTTFLMAPVAYRPILTAKRLSARQWSLALAAVCDTSLASPPHMVVKRVQIWRIWCPLVLLNNFK